MSPFDLPYEPAWQRGTLTLLHFFWQGMAVAVVLAAVLWLLQIRRARSRYALSLLAMLIMAACPLVTFAVMEGPTAKISAPVSTPAAATVSHWPGPKVPIADVKQPDDVPSQAMGTTPGFQPAPCGSTAVAWGSRLVGLLRTHQSYLLVGWALGVVLLSLRLSLSLLGVHWVSRGRRPIPAELAGCVARLCGRLGLRRVPRVMASERVREALVVGFLRPMVLLPASWLGETTPEILEAVIAHELAHIRRLDVWVNLLQRVVETLLFYHPAVWWLSRRVRLEREKCCDELAVAATGRRGAFVIALEFTASKRFAPANPALAPGMGGSTMVLLNRIRYIAGFSPSGDRARWWPVGLLLLLVPVAMWFASTNAAQTERATARDKEKKPASAHDAEAGPFDAWQKREKQIKSCRFEWVETRTIMKETQSSSPMRGPGKRFPAEDVVHQLVHTLTLDGDKMRYSREGPAPKADAAGFCENQLYVSTFDGEESRVFFGIHQSPIGTYPLGFPEKESHHSDVQNADVTSILLAFRASHSTMGITGPENALPLALASIDPKKRDLRGHRCVVVHMRNRNDSHQRSFWLDKERGFVVLRRVITIEDYQDRQLDIDYKKDARGRWIPIAWEYTSWSSSPNRRKLLNSKARVTKYEINPRVPAEEFRFEFPVGTFVQRADDAYIVRPDGTGRLITQEENHAGATYEELLRTNSGEAFPPGFAEMRRRVRSLVAVDAIEREDIVTDFTEYLSALQFDYRTFSLVKTAAYRLHSAGETEDAAALCRSVAGKYKEGPELLALADKLEGTARWNNLLGNSIEVTGVTVEGKAFDWTAYRGKVVLVIFWYMRRRLHEAEFANVMRNYELYHKRGFEVVGVSEDRDREGLRSALRENEIPWVNLYEAGEKAQPTMKRYSIRVWPTLVLVDRDGKVVSLKASGKELDRLLDKMIGPADKQR